MNSEGTSHCSKGSRDLKLCLGSLFLTFVYTQASKILTDIAKVIRVNLNGMIRKLEGRGIWVAQLVNHVLSAQVTSLQFVSSSPTSGLLLSAQSLLQILCPPLSQLQGKKKKSERGIISNWFQLCGSHNY